MKKSKENIRIEKEKSNFFFVFLFSLTFLINRIFCCLRKVLLKLK